MRKDTTITSLQAKVAMLQRTTDEMQKLFCRFNDSAMTSGVLQQKPRLAAELKDTTQKFISLSKAAEIELEEVEDPAMIEKQVTLDDSSVFQIEQRATDSTSISASPATQVEPLQSGSAELFQSNGVSNNSHGQLLDRRNGAHENEKYLPFAQFPPIPALKSRSSMTKTTPSCSMSLGGEQQQQWQIHIPNVEDYFLPPSAYNEVVPRPIVQKYPYYLEFGHGTSELSFSQRIIRIAYNGGYNLLLHSYLHPKLTSTVFKFFLALHTREAILQHLSQMLARESLDCPEYWEIPFVALGGAGTHYPQQDDLGLILPQRNYWKVVPTGQGHLARLVNGETDIDTGICVDTTLYNGDEWLDATEVECYLLEKGVRIAPEANFATCDVVNWPGGLPTPATNPSDTPSSLSDFTSCSSSCINNNAMNDFFPSTYGSQSRSSNSSCTPPKTPSLDPQYNKPCQQQQQHLSIATTQDTASMDNFAPSQEQFDIDPLLSSGGTFDGLLFPDGNAAKETPENHLLSDHNVPPDQMPFGLSSLGGGGGVLSPYDTTTAAGAALQVLPRQRVRIDVLTLIKGMTHSHSFYYFYILLI